MNKNFILAWVEDDRFHYLPIAEEDIVFHLERIKRVGGVLLSVKREGY